MTPATTAHPSAEKLNAFVLGRLDDPASAEIEAHLEVCEACQRLAENTPDDSLVETLQEPAPAAAESAESQPGLFARLAAIVNPQARKPAPRPASRSHQDVPAALRDHPRYEVLERLGAGGMGTVFKARHRLMDRVVALKVMNPSLLADPTAVGRFQREVKAAAQLAHPHIVTAYDAEQVGDVHFLAMEYVEGQTLAEIVDLRGPLPVHRACEYVRQTAIGLQYASQRGMVHRDIKPQNLVLTETGDVKVFDFGLARFVSESGEPGEGSTAGRMLGSPDYMAPEQAKDAHSADIRADIYSLGCTLYHLLTGLPPFPGGSAVEKLSAHLEKTPIEISKLRLDISADLERVVDRMLAKDPAQRFQTPGELAEALEPHCQPGPLVAPAKPPAAPAAAPAPRARPQIRLRRPDLRVAVAVALLLAASGLFFAGPIYRFVTDQGTLVVEIETNDPDVKVVVKQGGRQITILDSKTGCEVTLKSGEYQLELPAGQERLQLSPTEFRLARGSKQIARVRVPPPPPGPPELVEILELHTLVGHRGSVICVAFSPDGRYVLSGGADKTVRLWDVATGQEVRRFEGAAVHVHSVAFSPDGTRVAAADCGTEILLWDTATAQLLRRFEAHKGVLSVTFSPDGRCLASSGVDNVVRLWDASTGDRRRTLSGHKDQVRSVAFSPDGRQVVSGSWDKTVRLWDVPTGRQLRLFEGHAQQVMYVAFSANGKEVISGGADQTMRLWDIATGVEKRELFSQEREGAVGSRLGAGRPRSDADAPGHPTAIWGVALSPDGRRAMSGSGWVMNVDGRLSTAGSDYRVRLYDVISGGEIGRLDGHTSGITSVAFSPDGRLAVSGSYDKTVRILWLGEPGQPSTPRAPGNLGQLAVAEDSPGLPVMVKQAGRLVTVLHPRISSTAQLEPGEYELDLAGHPEDFELSAERVTLKAGAKQTLAIHTVPPSEKPPVVQLAEIRRFEGHTSYVEQAVFTPDGKRILSCSRDHTVRVWDAEAGREVSQFTGHAETVMAIALSPDGQQAVSASGGDWKDGNYVATDFTIRLWEVATGKEIRSFAGHSGWIPSLAYSPDGNYIVSGSNDGTARLWEAATGRELRRFSAKEGAVTSVAFSPDGRYVLTGGTDALAQLWDVETGRELRRFDGHTDEVWGVAFSPDGRLVVSGGHDRTSRIWDLTTGQQLRVFCHENTTGDVTFSPDGQRVVTGSTGAHLNSVSVWDVATGRELGRFDGHSAMITSVAFSPDGRRAVTASWDKTVRLLQLPEPPSLPITEIRRFEGPASRCWRVALSRDGQQALCSSDEPSLRLWDLQAGAAVRQFEAGDASSRGVAISPDGRLAASATWSMAGVEKMPVRLWDVSTGKELRRFTGHTRSVWDVAFTPDGRRVLSSGWDGTLRLWDVATGRQLRVFEGHGDGVTSVALSADGRFVLSGSHDKTARLWELQTGREVRRFEGHTSWVVGVALSPDGNRVLSGSADETVRLWDATSGRQLRLFAGHSSCIHCVAFLPDGKRAMSGSEDGSVLLWDVATGRELGRFNGFTNWVTGVATSHDGQSALACGRDGTLRLLKLPAADAVLEPAGPGETGRLTVESEAEDGWLLVKQRSRVIRLLDATATQTVNLAPGAYALELAGRTDGLRLSVDRFTLTAGGKQAVQIRPERKPARVEITEVRRFESRMDFPCSVALSRDGRCALTGGGKAARLWDIASGEQVRRFDGHTRTVLSVALSPDGRRALSGGGGHWHENQPVSDLGIRLWDTASGKQLRSFEGHTSQIQSLTFAADGRFALSGSMDGTARLWNVESGEQVHCFDGRAGSVQSVALSPEGRWAVTGSWDYAAILWDTASGEEVRRFVGEGWFVWSVAFSPDGAQVLTCSSDRTVRLWDRKTGELLRSFPHPTSLFSAAFSPDGQRIVSCSGMRVWFNGGYNDAGWDYRVRVWDVATGREIGCYDGLTIGHQHVTISSDGRCALVSSPRSPTRLLWFSETETSGKPAASKDAARLTVETNGFDLPIIVKQPDKLVTVIVPKISKQAELPPGEYELELAGQPDDFTLSAHKVSLAKNAKQTVSIREVPPVQPPHEITDLRRFDGHTGSVESVVFSTDGRQILSGAKDKTIRLWDVETGKEIRQFEGNTQVVFSVALSPDGRRALSAGSDRASGDFAIRLWDVETGKDVRSFSGHSGTIWSVVFSPDGRRAASGSQDGSVRLWEVSTGEQIREFTGHESDVRCVNFSPDGNRLLSASQDGTVRLWDAATGKELRCLEGHTHMAIWADFSPDGRQAVSCGYDWMVRLWDLDTGRQIRAFPRTPSCVVRVTFSPDGRRILGGSGWRIGGGAGHDNCVRLWDVDTGVELARFEEHTGPLLAVAFSPDGRTALSAGHDNVIRLLQLPEPGESRATPSQEKK